VSEQRLFSPKLLGCIYVGILTFEAQPIFNGYMFAIEAVVRR
jgi:hypothetical protein